MRDIDRDRFLGPDEAVEYGLADHVLRDARRGRVARYASAACAFVDELDFAIRVDLAGAALHAALLARARCGREGLADRPGLRRRARSSASARSASPRRACSCSIGTAATARASPRELGMPHLTGPRRRAAARRSRCSRSCEASAGTRWRSGFPALRRSSARMRSAPRRTTARGRAARSPPLLRLTPPRALLAVEPEHVLVGHGAGVHEDAPTALREAVDARAAPHAPAWLWSARAGAPP